MAQRVAGAGFTASRDARVGRYSYWPEGDRWWWSDAMYRLHGFEPGEVVPSTELVMRHIHPDDVPAAWDSRDQVLDRGEPFSFLHRIRTAVGQEREVLRRVIWSWTPAPRSCTDTWSTSPTSGSRPARSSSTRRSRTSSTTGQ